MKPQQDLVAAWVVVQVLSLETEFFEHVEEEPIVGMLQVWEVEWT